jgi:hypothetical protein
MLSGGAPEWGTVVGVSMVRGGVEVGRERKRRKKGGAPSAVRSS